MKNLDAPMSATYFREYGIHPVKRQGSDDFDYIASFPTWDETLDALAADLPDKGNIVTPEYIVAPENLLELNQHSDLINERIRTTRDLTKGSDAVLHLGTPTRVTDPKTGKPKWFNSVLTIHRGSIESATHKRTLVPAEEQIGITYPKDDLRRVKDGRAVLICAELFLYSMNPQHALQNKDVRQVLAPTMWATPLAPGQNLREIEKAGGEDPYYRQQLEKAVGSYLMRDMPTVDRVIVSDRGRPDLAPYNAVFDRTKPQLPYNWRSQ